MEYCIQVVSHEWRKTIQRVQEYFTRVVFHKMLLAFYIFGYYTELEIFLPCSVWVSKNQIRFDFVMKFLNCISNLIFLLLYENTPEILFLCLLPMHSHPSTVGFVNLIYSYPFHRFAWILCSVTALSHYFTWVYFSFHFNGWISHVNDLLKIFSQQTTTARRKSLLFRTYSTKEYSIA